MIAFPMPQEKSGTPGGYPEEGTPRALDPIYLYITPPAMASRVEFF